LEKFLEAAKQALADEFLERVSEATFNEILAKIPARKQGGDRHAAN
jgi:hypothetical protein